ncbi:unnamed protein product [Rhizoctonia solani]|uniref:Protein kinase domain-containing protein n=1 Tax=Rhizoctonia solani TaxID=456999 RepID=A0A8H2WYR4_9AGAM|nr:unnamed protein product [Rhizoctonia solani]CAE6484163.1 unnamed protein product [Rhizoctonia solani]
MEHDNPERMVTSLRLPTIGAKDTCPRFISLPSLCASIWLSTQVLLYESRMSLKNSRFRRVQRGAGPDSSPQSQETEEIVGQASSIEEIVEILSKRGCADLTLEIDFNKCSDYAVAGGGYCDVFRGVLHSGTIIAIKSLRVYDNPGADKNRKKLLKHAAKELYHWSKLDHPNILPLMGLALYRGYISMVSEWMSDGNLTSYIRTNPTVDRMGLCVGICAGLFYIHEKGMVHGDLKGASYGSPSPANVMISSTGEALIADFGNAHLRELTLRFTNTTNPGLSFRWAAPELFTEEDNKPNTKSDVYAYGMTALARIYHQR